MVSYSSFLATDWFTNLIVESMVSHSSFLAKDWFTNVAWSNPGLEQVRPGLKTMALSCQKF